MTIAAIPALFRPLLESRLPHGLDVRWFESIEDALALAPFAEIGWYDFPNNERRAAAMTAAVGARWINSLFAGVDALPLTLMHERGTIYTNGAGINAITIAEYVVMGMLTAAKGYDEIVRARDRRDWLPDAPGKVELAGSKALLLGAGAIGGLVASRLAAFDVAVRTVRRSPGVGDLGPDDWRATLGDYDWVILAVPATPETVGMIGAAELAAMKTTATVINIARGSVIDQDALVAALTSGAIAHAFLDVTTPEPLLPDDPLWALPNAHLTMHLSGRSQDKMYVRSADRFLENLRRWENGEPMLHRVDLIRGY